MGSVHLVFYLNFVRQLCGWLHNNVLVVPLRYFDDFLMFPCAIDYFGLENFVHQSILVGQPAMTDIDTYDACSKKWSKSM